MKSLAAHLLVASPQLQDPNFFQTVVLIIQHTDQGAFGVILNRQANRMVKEIWESVCEEPCDNEQRINLGGPVSGPLLAIHTAKPLADLEIMPGVFISTSKDKLTQLAAQHEHPFRVYLGCAGWAGGQLENELKEGAWLTARATDQHIFYKTDDLWKTVNTQILTNSVLPHLRIDALPDDPSEN